MSTSALNRWLVSQVASGNCVLFVGAGFSRACVDATGRRGPLGRELAGEVAKKFLGQDDNRTLATTCAYAASLTSRIDVESFIRARLNGLVPSAGARYVPLLPWKSIYSTNFDLVIERAYAEAESPAKRVFPVYDDRTPLRDLKADQIPLYKLHGCISRLDQTQGTLVLTGEDMAKARVRRRKLFSV